MGGRDTWYNEKLVIGQKMSRGMIKTCYWSEKDTCDDKKLAIGQYQVRDIIVRLPWVNPATPDV